VISANKDKLSGWKGESKGLKVSMNRTKIIINEESCKVVQNTRRWLCDVWWKLDTGTVFQWSEIGAQEVQWYKG